MDLAKELTCSKLRIRSPTPIGLLFFVLVYTSKLLLLLTKVNRKIVEKPIGSYNEHIKHA